MERAFHLEVGEDHLATLTFDLPDRKANIFTREALAELDRLLAELAGRDDIGCLVLLSAKPGMFIAGADVAEIAGVTDPEEAEAGSRYGHRLFSAWERLPFPTVSAVSGTCLGGGTELSLASTYIVVSDRAFIVYKLVAALSVWSRPSTSFSPARRFRRARRCGSASRTRSSLPRASFTMCGSSPAAKSGASDPGEDRREG